MKVLQRYFFSEILQAVVFVLFAFLALFLFFDLMGELQSVGQSGYRLQHAFLYVLLGLPNYAYELMPIAALIGTIYVLAQLAARSEFSIMRVSGLSIGAVAWMLSKIGLVLVVCTFLIGEFASPFTARVASALKLHAQGSSYSQGFRSGLWTKDVIKNDSDKIIGTRFINANQLQSDGQLQGVKIYELDTDFRIIGFKTADLAQYVGPNLWRLKTVIESTYPNITFDDNVAPRAVLNRLSSQEMKSDVTPEILSVLFADPDKMSAIDLAAYTKHLAENKEKTERYEIALWKKITYPFAIFVMMALALPFAYLHVRSGGVSLKIFIGIMIGVVFQLINNLFSHLGLLNTWPAPMTAVLPSLLFMCAAVAALLRVERY